MRKCRVAVLIEELAVPAAPPAATAARRLMFAKWAFNNVASSAEHQGLVVEGLPLCHCTLHD